MKPQEMTDWKDLQGGQEIDLYGSKEGSDGKSERARLWYNVATCNAMSMVQGRNQRRKAKDKSHITNGLKQDRHQLLRTQFHDWRLLLIGIQEARGTESKQYADNYLTLRSSGDVGGHGCALLVATDTPYATTDKHEYFLNVNQLRVLDKSPTCLVVRIAAPFLNITVAVMHAPHLRVNVKEREGGGRKPKQPLRNGNRTSSSSMPTDRSPRTWSTSHGSAAREQQPSRTRTADSSPNWRHVQSWP